ncbi:MAG: Hsp20/alpha crystallin family protein [Bacteroidetes bacterium]|nr:Hsp20/alpha crystallin family protein [Fibrella sp.]
MAAYIRYNTLPALFNRTIFNQLARPYYAPTTTPVAVNVREDNTAFHLDVAAPGLNKNEFKVSVVGNKLTVAYHHEATEAGQNDTFTRHEFAQANFERSFQLPKNVNADQIQAAYTDGILTLDLPKVEVKAIESKEIAVA